MLNSSIRRVAMIGNFVPRRCGLATFTADAAHALIARGIGVDVLAMNDRRDGYAYPDPVCFEIFQDDPISYIRAAEFLNLRSYDVVNLQHEFGIFGGPDGVKILGLLREISAPLVTTLHTILRDPSPHQRAVFEEILELSERVVVMSETGRQILGQTYGYDRDRVDFVPHGVPDVELQPTGPHKEKLGLGDRPTLLTFGLVSPDKGIENVLYGLPKVVESFPEVLYFVVGQTHPHVVERQGERYRERLEALVDELGLGKNVRFQNAFVPMEDLVGYLLASDIYVTPYRKLAQITSGTLSYAVGCGKAIVSTPLWHAEELLAEGRGILVPPDAPYAITDAVLGLLHDREARESLQERTYRFGRSMTWPNVAKQLIETFREATKRRGSGFSTILERGFRSGRIGAVPTTNYEHLKMLSDDTGLLQHAKFAVPDRDFGYCTDDNARGLLLATMLGERGLKRAGLQLETSRYIGFLHQSFDETSGRFRNFMSYDRRWLEDCGSEDSHGRALWALGALVRSDLPVGWRNLGLKLFCMALPAVCRFVNPRPWAFALLGLEKYLQVYSGDRNARRVRNSLSNRLKDLYHQNKEREWKWCEPKLTYDNARLPQAVFLAGTAEEDAEMVQCGLESLRWLCEIQKGPHDLFLPIGNDGFWERGGTRARLDQQPLEAWATVSAAVDAYRFTGEPIWKSEARRAFRWFLGENSLGQPLYDPDSGGCRDGIGVDRVSENMGAESTLAFAIARLEMSRIDTELLPVSEGVTHGIRIRLS